MPDQYSDAEAEPVKLRPAYHITSERNWLNDPNGLVYIGGRYHAYFQHNPLGHDWGHMSWGHVSSPDLQTWTEHPIALWFDSDHPDGGEQIYSGSIVVDQANSSGFGTGEGPPLVAVYTSAYGTGRQAQSLAYSHDQGLTWTKHDQNPVLDRSSTAFRDPKVFRHQDHWIMVTVEAEAGEIVLYRSDDLRQWTFLSTFEPDPGGGRVWECPDLFPLPYQGSIRWVLLASVNPDLDSQGSGMRHLIGDFDGVRFVPEPGIPLRKLDFGPDFYAAVSFDNVCDGRRIILGWLNNWDYAARTPTEPWRGVLSVPRELSLVEVDGRPVLRQQPVLATDTNPSDEFQLDGIEGFEFGRVGRVDLTYRPETASRFGVDVLVAGDERVRLSYDRARSLLTLDRSRSGAVDFAESFSEVAGAVVPLLDDELALTVLVDRSTVEVFAADGTITLSQQVFPHRGGGGVELWSDGLVGTTLAWSPITKPDCESRH